MGSTVGCGTRCIHFARWRAPFYNAAFLVCLGCSQQAAVDGIWQGSNPQYPLVTFVLTETGDSLSGSATVALTTPPDSIVSVTVIGTWNGDSVYLRGPLMPSLGADTRYFVEFSGKISIAGALLGSINADRQAASAILLNHHGGQL